MNKACQIFEDTPRSENNKQVACSTTTGNQYLYDGRESFGRFRETTDEIARLQSNLREEYYSSKQIHRLYQQRTKRRDHT